LDWEKPPRGDDRGAEGEEVIEGSEGKWWKRMMISESEERGGKEKKRKEGIKDKSEKLTVHTRNVKLRLMSYCG